MQGRYPKAPILAIGANGLIVEMPDSVPRIDNPVLYGRSGLDSVPPDDHRRLIEAFERLLENGTAQCVLHPPVYGEVTWYGFDLRVRHGVLVALLGVDADSRPVLVEDSAREMIRVGPPRFATIRKDEHGFVTSVAGAVTEIRGWMPAEMRT